LTRYASGLCLLTIAFLLIAGTPLDAWADGPEQSFALWQLPNQTPTQMMSYVLQTQSGKLIVIDGGMPGDASYLRTFLEGLGGKVEAWFISHVHSDHVGALGEILGDPGDVRIGALYGSIPGVEWVQATCTAAELAVHQRFLGALRDANQTVRELAVGEEQVIDGVRIEVLGVRNPEITRNPMNNSSVVLRVSDAATSILFLGDLGVEGGEKLLNGPYGDRLHADYCQMAHHGQNGVGEKVYQAVRPTYCLWPAPKWLWDNDNGGGEGSGPWRTLEVRMWMEKLPVKAHYVIWQGLYQFGAARR